MSVTKKGFSAKEMQRQLSLRRYEPVWSMVHKLRKAMGNRDARYTLEGMIELDEGYFTIEASEVEKQKGIRGRGAVGKQNVLVLAESTPLEDPVTGKAGKHVRYFKARVLESQDKNELTGEVSGALVEKSIVASDKRTSYVDIADYVKKAFILPKNQQNRPQQRPFDGYI